MSKYVQKKLNANRIITGDCLSVMASLPNESVNIVLTSPPYNVGLNYDGFDDNLSNDDFIEFNRQWLREAYRIAAETARAYVIVSDKMLFWMRGVAEDTGWTFGQILTWCKPNTVGRLSGRIKGDWAYMTEQILLFRKGKRTSMLNAAELGTRTFSWFVEAIPQSNTIEGRIHPCQLPLSLCIKILSRTPGDLVLDPFAGSGQVLRAARAVGKSYIGIELVPSVAEKARRFVGGQHTSQLREANQDALFYLDEPNEEVSL